MFGSVPDTSGSRLRRAFEVTVTRFRPAASPFVHSFYEAVIITCDPDNHASRRTIERLGARFMDEVPVSPDDPHYQRGSRSKRRYTWTP